MSDLVCKGANCNTFMYDYPLQKKYCKECKVKRERALVFVRNLRKEVTELSNSRVYEYNIKIKHLHDNLIFVASHKTVPLCEVKCILTEHNDVDTSIILKNIYKALKLISTKASEHKGML